MSFGPKLNGPLVVAPGSEIAATLHFTPTEDEFAQNSTIYVEEAEGVRMLKITAKSPPRETAP